MKSNAILLAADGATVGVGMGQVNRVDAARGSRSPGPVERATGAVAASDAFFPFADGLEVLLDAGVRAVVQPGGSVRDEEVVEAAAPGRDHPVLHRHPALLPLAAVPRALSSAEPGPDRATFVLGGAHSFEEVAVEDQEDADLSHADLSGAELHGLRFTRCDLVEADLSELLTRGCVFDECDFSGATPQRLSRTTTPRSCAACSGARRSSTPRSTAASSPVRRSSTASSGRSR